MTLCAGVRNDLLIRVVEEHSQAHIGFYDAESVVVDVPLGGALCDLGHMALGAPALASGVWMVFVFCMVVDDLGYRVFICVVVSDHLSCECREWSVPCMTG